MASNKVNTELPTPRTPADGLALIACPDTGGPNFLYNGATLDLERNDVDFQIAPSANRSTNYNSPDFIAYNHESLLVCVNVTVAGPGSYTASIEHFDQWAVTPGYVRIWTAEIPITATGSYVYYFANGASGGGGFAECLAFGIGSRTCRVAMTVNSGNLTFSIGGVLGDT